MAKARANKRRVHKAIKGKKGKTAGKMLRRREHEKLLHKAAAATASACQKIKKRGKKQKPPLRSSNLKPNTKPKANDAVNPVDCSTA